MTEDQRRRERQARFVADAMHITTRLRALLAEAAADVEAQALEHVPDAIYELDQFIWWLTEGADTGEEGDDMEAAGELAVSGRLRAPLMPPLNRRIIVEMGQLTDAVLATAVMRMRDRAG